MRSSTELDCRNSKLSFTEQIFLKVRNKLATVNTEVLWGKTSVDIPCKKLVSLSREVSAAHSGPDRGISTLMDTEPYSNEDIINIDWTKWHHRAYGMATSLYEKSPDGKRLSGDPVADVFAVVARPNNCILVLADGVNWGEKALLAAKTAVKGCMEYLNKNLFDSINTHDIMKHLVHSFQHAQKCITDSEATMTTLCAGVVCELQGSNNWGFCTLNVGDSLAFVYNRNRGLREVTIGSHADVQRDMCNPGGSLGRVDGYNPDLANLTCSFTLLEAGDIVFLTSDGITDNFDPVVCKPCPKEMTSLKQVLKEAKESCKHEKTVEFDQRHREMIEEMEKALVTLDDDADLDLSAREVCAFLISKVAQTTDQKRRFLEKAFQKENTYDSMEGMFRKVKNLPGKLDHACVVAYEVGYFPPSCLRLVCDGDAPARQWSHDSGYRTASTTIDTDSHTLELRALDLARSNYKV